MSEVCPSPAGIRKPTPSRSENAITHARPIARGLRIADISEDYKLWETNSWR